MPWAIRNADGFWGGIWSSRELAESVRARGQPSHKEELVELVEAKFLRELVALKDLADEADAKNYAQNHPVRIEYRKLKQAAWDAARAALKELS